MSLGADTLTLQHSDFKSRCEPDPAIGKACDFYIGVYGWRNSSYAVSATVDDGFQSPTLLIDQLPASGSVSQGGYRYFMYYVSIDPPGPNSRAEPLALQFLLTPTGTYLSILH